MPSAPRHRPARLFLLLIALLVTIAAPVFCREPWPMKTRPLVGAQFHDFQNYSKVPYLHGGADLRAPAGTPVYTPVSGTVTLSSYRIDASRSPLRFAYIRSPFRPEKEYTSKYIEACISTSDGTVWYFRHLDAASIPQAVISKAGRGIPVEAGERLGTIVGWSESVLPPTEKYDHIHLEILASDGTYLNPISLLELPPDRDAPVIQGIWAVPNEGSTAFDWPEHRPVVSGDIDIVIGITDTVTGSAYRHSPYLVRAGLRRENGSETAVLLPMADVFRFDTLPIHGDRTQLATVIYRESVRTAAGEILANGSGGPRYFLMTLTNGNPVLGYRPEYSLRTRDLADGVYILDVEASDLTGNTARRSFEFLVRNSR
ncbi:MAG TPA: M23 family metallopeptidase [Candidatus Ozemobacteraceae bacterium]|nr:M23 family metallopeptidase [Candidatus Ozemobacteraceae bacterium]